MIVIDVFIDTVRFTNTDVEMFVDTDICPLPGLPHISEFVQDDGTLLSDRHI